MVLPQLRPALLGGMLLVALNTLVEFGAFALLRFRTFTTELYAEYRTGTDGAESSLVALRADRCSASRACWRNRSCGVVDSTRGQPASRGRRAQRHRLGWLALPVLAGFALLTAATLGVPHRHGRCSG